MINSDTAPQMTVNKMDGFVKSPTSGLRCIPRHCDVR
jgi:hypothetical protein